MIVEAVEVCQRKEKNWIDCTVFSSREITSFDAAKRQQQEQCFPSKEEHNNHTIIIA